jgi:hypothetical protein
MAAKRDPRLERYGLEGYNKPKLTPGHSKKRAVVLAKDGDTVKLIRFGDQTMTTAGKPNKSDTKEDKARRASFKARHSAGIEKGKLSGSYWSNRTFW